MTEQEIINELLIMAGNYEDSEHEPCIKDAALFRHAAQKIAEAQKDSKRLDWMHEKGCIEIECCFPSTYIVDPDGLEAKGKTLRAAIDNAMEKFK